MAKLMAPNIRIDWYPEGHFADVHNPTIEELNSGVNLSCAIVTGFTLDFVDSNTEDTTTILDTHTSEAILNHSYEADLEFFLAPRGSNAGNEKAYRKAEELFYNEENRVGYLAKRFGFPWNEPYGIEQPRQRVDLFKVQADLPKVVSEDGAPILLKVKYIPQGEAVSGAMSGHIRYEWEGVPHNSPSRKSLGTDRYTYAWAGDVGLSESIKYKNGVEVARNRAINPSYEASSTTGLSFGSAVSAGSRSSQDWRVVSGSYAAYYTFEDGGSGNLATTFVQQETKAKQGQWVAFSVYGSSSDSSRYFGGVISERAGNSHNTHHISYDYQELNVTNIWESRVTQVAQVSMPDTDTVRFGVHFSSTQDDYTFPGTNGFVYLDGWVAAVADTKEEALAQVEEFFDGDTPDHIGELLSKNIFPNPQVNGLGELRQSSGVQVVETVPRGDKFPWLPDFDTVSRFRSAPDATGTQYVYRVIPATPGMWYSVKASIQTPNGGPGRMQLQFRENGSTISSHGETDNSPPKEGKVYTYTEQAPTRANELWVLVWPPVNPPYTDWTYFTGIFVGEGRTKAEAEKQTEDYYFDGDTVDK